jgi:hypothetical protein
MIWRILNSFVDTRGGAVGAMAAPATRASGVKVPQTINTINTQQAPFLNSPRHSLDAPTVSSGGL